MVFARHDALDSADSLFDSNQISAVDCHHPGCVSRLFNMEQLSIFDRADSGIFPIFYDGHLYGKRIISWIRTQKYKVPKASAILIVIAVVMSFTKPSPYWLYGSLSYQQLKVDWIEGSLIRIGCLLLSAFGIYAVFALSAAWGAKFRTLGDLGKRTLPVYLLHGFVVIAISHLMSSNPFLTDLSSQNHFLLQFAWGIEVALCFVLSVLSCWLLQHPLLDQFLRTLSLWLMKPTEKFWK